MILHLKYSKTASFEVLEFQNFTLKFMRFEYAQFMRFEYNQDLAPPSFYRDPSFGGSPLSICNKTCKFLATFEYSLQCNVCFLYTYKIMILHKHIILKVTNRKSCQKLTDTKVF